MIRDFLPRDSRECVCSTCTCGNHHCPGVLRSLPFEGNSIYRIEFVKKPVEPRHSIAFPREVHTSHAVPGHFKTTSQVASESISYGSPALPCKPQCHLPSRTPFVSTTTHRSDYRGFDPLPRACSAPPKVVPHGGVGTYETTVGVMQGPVVRAILSGGYRRSEPIRQEANLVTAPRKFEATSSYRLHYSKKTSVVDRVRCSFPSFSLLDDRDFVTTSKGTFIAPPILPVCPAACFIARLPSRDGHIKIS